MRVTGTTGESNKENSVEVEELRAQSTVEGHSRPNNGATVKWTRCVLTQMPKLNNNEQQ